MLGLLGPDRKLFGSPAIRSLNLAAIGLFVTLSQIFSHLALPLSQLAYIMVTITSIYQCKSSMLCKLENMDCVELSSIRYSVKSILFGTDTLTHGTFYCHQ